MERLIKDIKQKVIKQKDIKPNELISYINNNSINESDIKNSSFDLLFFAIEKGNSLRTLETIINCFPNAFGNLNYLHKKHTPITAALATGNIEIAEFLKKFNARINFHGHRFHNVLLYLYQRKLLKETSLRYLLVNNVETYGNTFFETLIMNNNTEFLNIYLSLISPYSNDFIIRILCISRNRIPTNKEIFKNFIDTENNKLRKLILDKNLIDHICFHSNVETLSIILKNRILRQQFHSLVNYRDLLYDLYIKGKKDQIKIMVDHGAKINHFDSSLFLKIIINNDLEMAENFIKNGIYINYNFMETLPIWKAYECSHNEMVKLLLRHGADLFINDKDYEKILKLAMDKEENILPHISKYYFSYCNSKSNKKLYNYFENSTLTYAIKNQNPVIVEHLLQTNTYHFCWSVENKSDYFNAYEAYNPELILACTVGNTEVVNLLLRKGADVNYIWQKKYQEILTPLIAASKNNKIELVEHLLDCGAQANIKIPDFKKGGISFKSALMYACENGNKKMTELLVKKGKANVNQKDSNGKTVFMYACESGNKDIIQLLINNHCDITDKDNNENTVLHYLCSKVYQNRHYEVIQYLINTKRFDLNMKNKNKTHYTVLEEAVMNSNKSIYKLLIENGANINCLSVISFENIIINDDLKMVEYLINKGAYVNYFNFDYLLFWKVYELKNNDLLKLLLRHGADLFINDKDYEKILKLAMDMDKEVNILPHLSKYYNSYNNYRKNYSLENYFENSTLVFAIKNQNNNIIKHLLQANAFHYYNRFNKSREDFNSEFILACNIGNIDSVKLFLEKGVNINYLYKDTNDNQLYTPLSKASKTNNIKLVKILLDHGALSNIQDTFINYKSPLIHACEQGHEKIVEYLVENRKNGGADIHERDYYGKTALMYALKNGNEESSSQNYENIINYLVGKGVNVNEKDYKNRTALMYACKYRNSKSIVELLINKMCCITEEDKNGNNALHYMCQNKDLENKIDILKMLIETNKFNINKQNHIKETALHFASTMDNVNSVKYLIENGADINSLTKNKYSPLIYACRYGNKKVVITFVEEKCDVNIKGYKGKTALIFALENGHLDVAEYLMKHANNIVIDEICPNGNSILIYASRFGRQSLVEYILKKFSKDLINTSGIENKTPLMYACEYGHYNIAKYLISHGAKMNAISIYHNTPLIYAAMNNYMNIVEYLLKFSPKNIETPNKKGKTAESYAILNKNFFMVKKLKEAKNNIMHMSKKLDQY